MNIFGFLSAFSKCKDAATANNIGGSLGTALSVGCGALIAGGYVEQFRDFVCKASADDIGLAVATIGVAASLLNSGTTKALSPAKTAPVVDNISHNSDLVADWPLTASETQPAEPHNCDLERVKMPFPVARKR